MKTKLFTEDTESYTLVANQIGNEFDQAIRALFEKYGERYYARELEVIAMSSVSMAAVQVVMNAQKQISDARNAEMAANIADPDLAKKVREYCHANYSNHNAQNQYSLIQAVKACRHLTGMGLKDAKE